MSTGRYVERAGKDWQDEVDGCSKLSPRAKFLGFGGQHVTLSPIGHRAIGLPLVVHHCTRPIITLGYLGT